MWSSRWAWGDPSHTRVITADSLVFLDQTEYDKQIGKTSMSDFRTHYRADFDPIHLGENEHELGFALRAVKPSRITV